MSMTGAFGFRHRPCPGHAAWIMGACTELAPHFSVVGKEEQRSAHSADLCHRAQGRDGIFKVAARETNYKEARKYGA